ncbi:MAG: four helix bundle protein [Chthoniobacterales bacterium]
MFNFEKLETWQKAIDFATLIYEITSKFPSDERFGLTSQLRRAAVSVSSNIAEGASRSSKKEYARFVEIATGSLFEVVSQAHVAKRLEYLDDLAFDAIYDQSDDLSRMLSGLRNYLAPTH